MISNSYLTIIGLHSYMVSNIPINPIYYYFLSNTNDIHGGGHDG